MEGSAVPGQRLLRKGTRWLGLGRKGQVSSIEKLDTWATVGAGKMCLKMAREKIPAAFQATESL